MTYSVYVYGFIAIHLVETLVKKIKILQEEGRPPRPVRPPRWVDEDGHDAMTMTEVQHSERSRGTTGAAGSRGLYTNIIPFHSKCKSVGYSI